MLTTKPGSLFLLFLYPLSNPLPSFAQNLTAPMLSFPASRSATQASQLSPPMSFEVNRGQVRKEIDFVARGQGYSAYLSAGGVALHLSRIPSFGPAARKAPTEVKVSIDLVNANPQPELLPETKLPGRSNYLLGPDPGKWMTDVTHYGKVRYRNVYPGIDVVYYGNQSRLEHDFVIHSGADARQIRLAFSGVRRMELSSPSLSQSP